MKLSDRVTKVRYLGKHGTSWDQEHANKYLVVDQIYTVSVLEIGDYSSVVYLKEANSRPFKTVMFEEVEELHLDLEEIAEEIKLYANNCNLSFKDVLEELQAYEY